MAGQPGCRPGSSIREVRSATAVGAYGKPLFDPGAHYSGTTGVTGLANAAFQKLREKVAVVTPASLLLLDDATLRDLGFSRKTRYTRLLALAVQGGELDLARLEHLPDEVVRTELKRLKGIGDWTADIYLSECLLRTDILPKGDIAMQEAFRVLNGLEKRPLHADFELRTDHWRPWRSVGTRMLWHFYLCERGRVG